MSLEIRRMRDSVTRAFGCIDVVVRWDGIFASRVVVWSADERKDDELRAHGLE
jgi:hypothetical protein